MRPPYTIEIERMVPWDPGEDGPPFPRPWNCDGYACKGSCFHEATVRVYGRCGRISRKLCNSCGIAFAARWRMHLPGTEPGSKTVERLRSTAAKEVK